MTSTKPFPAIYEAFLIVIFEIIIEVTLHYFFPAWYATRWGRIVIVMLSFFAVILVLHINRTIRFSNIVLFPKTKWIYFVLGLALLAAVYIGIILIPSLIVHQWSFVQLPRSIFYVSQESYSWIIIYILIGPLCEELIHRGIILRGFLYRFVPFKAIIFSSLLFTVTHIDIYYPQRLIGVFVGGLILGYLFYITKNIWLCILCHSFYNSLFFINDNIHRKIINIYPSYTFLQPIELFLMAWIFLLFLGLLLFLFKKEICRIH